MDFRSIFDSYFHRALILNSFLFNKVLYFLISLTRRTGMKRVIGTQKEKKNSREKVDIPF